MTLGVPRASAEPGGSFRSRRAFGIVGRVFSTDAGSPADDVIAGAMSGDGDAVADVADPAALAGGEGDEGHGAEGHGAEGDGDEPLFWGMQNEGMENDRVGLTGAALRSGGRRLAVVCLAVALGLGVVFWAVLVVLYAHRVFFQGATTNPDMPRLTDGRPWAAYYLAGSLWAVGIGGWGLATRGGFTRLAWCFSCLVTAFFWPLGLAASVAAVAVRRPAAAMPRRVLLGGLAAVLVVGGSVWRFAAPSAKPKPTAVASDADLLGTWRSHSGMSVELRSDGTYAASALSGGGLGDGDGVPASSGRWDSETANGDSGVRLQVDGELASSLLFDVYRAGPDLVLCASTDSADPCTVALRRG